MTGRLLLKWQRGLRLLAQVDPDLKEEEDHLPADEEEEARALAVAQVTLTNPPCSAKSQDAEGVEVCRERGKGDLHVEVIVMAVMILRLEGIRTSPLQDPLKLQEDTEI
mmetsp:Transcript_6518/g.16169  ORF Transcript_6518/g.16169 Transcript_6518/m.16169 type:complete len:109 (-) Transcript_6518:2591-2917(-)